MQDETKLWLNYAEENFDAAEVLLESDLYNPCLHNVQQTIEKAFRAVFIEKLIPFKKTHNIMELEKILDQNNVTINLTDDECDFLDSIYLPSKYPLGSALPFFNPGRKICESSILLAERVLSEVKTILG